LVESLNIILISAWAPALGGQVVEIIWLGIAHPAFPSLEIV